MVEHLSTFSDRVALIDSLGKYTYDDVCSQIAKYKLEFHGKINSGETVAIISDYNFYSIALFFALLDVKCILVPIVSVVTDEVNERIKAARCNKTVKINYDGELSLVSSFYDEPFKMVEDLVRLKHSGLILFSSGSTGEPKAMIHDLNLLVDSYKGKKSKKMVILVFLMFDHIGGLNTLLNSFMMGVQVVLPRFRECDEVALLIQTHKVQVLPASPTFLNLMLMGNVTEKYDLSSLRMITYGTESMAKSLLERLRVRFPKVKFLQTFGTSETGIAKTESRSSSSLEIKFDDPNLEYKIVDSELWLKSKTQIIGYLNASSDNFTDSGWFKTGDLVEEMNDGFLRIVGRNKEMINVGGEKVMPSEVESVLLEIDKVKDVVVRGGTNAITGNMVEADIVWAGDEDKQEIRKIIRVFSRTKLSSYKIPVKINIVDALDYSSRFKKKRL